MKVAVIGAGPSGLTTLKTLREAGLDARGFEAGPRVGGQWVLDNPSGTSAAYRSLRTNTNPAMSRFTDFAFPADYPDYPSHEQMADWLARYAAHFGLADHIALETRVERVEPEPDGGFLVAASGRAQERFDAVVAATGNLWDPIRPSTPGSFDGPILHSKDYRDPTTPVDLRGRRVLVVGLGNSGCEIAAELSREARVLLSARSGNFIFPRLAPGRPAPPHPSEPIPALFRLLPVRIRDALFAKIFPRALARMTSALPRPESVGLPPAPSDPFQKRAIVNDEILRLLAEGRVTARPGLRAYHGREVEFEDGSREAIDAVVLATGYRFSLPYLAPEVLGVADPMDLRLYRGILHPRHPRLFVVGVMRVFCSIWPMAEQQAKWVAARLLDRFPLPSPRELERRAYPILREPVAHCPFRAHDLRREAGGR
ncbi:MAG: NAD(P)-binding domain-containing protein [Deltaproteobacteria bacterium]|nr:NAD(P)-binding domain-containing protein [Deltaproteobacteria bacterium]